MNKFIRVVPVSSTPITNLPKRSAEEEREKRRQEAKRFQELLNKNKNKMKKENEDNA